MKLFRPYCLCKNCMFNIFIGHTVENRIEGENLINIVCGNCNNVNVVSPFELGYIDSELLKKLMSEKGKLLLNQAHQLAVTIEAMNKEESDADV